MTDVDPLPHFHIGYEYNKRRQGHMGHRGVNLYKKSICVHILYINHRTPLILRQILITLTFALGELIKALTSSYIQV